MKLCLLCTVFRYDILVGWLKTDFMGGGEVHIMVPGQRVLQSTRCGKT